MQHLDTIIAISFILLFIAQTASLATSAINKAQRKRQKAFNQWANLSQQRIDNYLGQQTDLAPQIKQQALSSINTLISEHENDSHPYLKKQTLLANILSIIAPNVSATNLTRYAAGLESTIDTLDEQTTRLFKLDATQKTTGVAIVISFMFQLNIFHMIEVLSNNPAVTQQWVVEQIKVLESQRQDVAVPQKEAIRQETEQLIHDQKQRLAQTSSVFQLPSVWFAEDTSKDLFQLYTILGCLITGILAGLGAPFWRQQLDMLLSLKNRTKSDGKTGPAIQSLIQPVTSVSSEKNNPGQIILYQDQNGSISLKNIHYVPYQPIAEVDLMVTGSPAEIYSDDDDVIADAIAALQRYNTTPIEQLKIRQRLGQPLKYFTSNN